MKLSYSCSQNLQSVINGHNAKINKKLHNENDPHYQNVNVVKTPVFCKKVVIVKILFTRLHSLKKMAKNILMWVYVAPPFTQDSEIIENLSIIEIIPLKQNWVNVFGTWRTEMLDMIWAEKSWTGGNPMILIQNHVSYASKKNTLLFSSLNIQPWIKEMKLLLIPVKEHIHFLKRKMLFPPYLWSTKEAISTIDSKLWVSVCLKLNYIGNNLRSK